MITFEGKSLLYNLQKGMIHASHTKIGLLLCMLIAVSCAEEKQYSHREEIITRKIWREDSLHTLQLFETLEDTLPSDSSLLTPRPDSISTKPQGSL